MTSIQVTGIRTVADAERAIAIGAAALALRLGAGLPGAIDTATARAIVDAVGARALVVGVFVDTPLAAVRAAKDAARLGCVELAGDEPPELLAPLLPHAYKVLRARDAGLVEAARRYGGRYMRLELGGAADPDALQGALQRAAHLARARRVTLAGGLGPDDVGAAIARVAPFCVDFGVPPDADGLDAARLAAFVAAVRAADAQIVSARPG